MNIDYFDNQFVSSENVSYPSSDLGLQRGFGVFETMRAEGGVIFQADLHLDRLRNSARLISLPYPWEDGELRTIWHEGLTRNHLDQAGIKVIITGGSSNFLAQQEPPRLLIQFRELHGHPEELYLKGAGLRTSHLVRELPAVKSLNYLSSVIAWRAAQAEGDHEGLFIGPDDEVRECTTANVFFVHDQVVSTPSAHILAGTTRQLVLRLAETAGLRVEVRTVPLTEAVRADEVFITSVNRRIMPAVSIDGQTIGAGTIGPITKQLTTAFRAYEVDYFSQHQKGMFR